jgi:uncharacterized coiled-coil protein SlyX
MSIALNAKVEALERIVAEQQGSIVFILDKLVEAVERIEKLEQRSKPGPKPKESA